MVPGVVRRAARRHHARRGLHQHGADRCLPRRRAPRGGAPDRAARRPPGRRARPRSGRRAAAQLRHRVPVHHGHRSRRTTPATMARRSTRRSRCPTTPASRRAGQRRAARGNYRGIGLSTWVEICGLAPSAVTKAIGIGAGGWESSIVRLHPTGSVTVITGSSAHGQGHETSLVADRRERARHPVRPGRRRPRRHGPVAVRARHLRLALAGGRRHGAAADLREGARQGAPDRRAPARVLGRRPRVVARASGRSRARPSAPRRSRSWRYAAWAGDSMPDGRRAEPRGDDVLRPAELHVPVRHAHRRGRDRRRDRQDRHRALHGGRRLRQRDQSDDRRGPGARRHRAVDRAGALRGDGLRRERPDPHGHARRLHDPLGGRAAAHGHGAHGHAVALQSARGEGHRRGGDDRGHRGVVNAAVDALSGLGVRHLEMPMQPGRVWEAIQQAKAGN